MPNFKAKTLQSGTYVPRGPNVITTIFKNHFDAFNENYQSKLEDTSSGYRLEHIVKHEFGHALCLGHANFKNTLMSLNVNEIISKISVCELESVRYANQWKILDKEDSPHTLDNHGFNCKKK